MANSKQTSESETTEQAYLRLRAERKARSPHEQLERERQFKLENAEAFASVNAWVEEHGLPLAKFRQF